MVTIAFLAVATALALCSYAYMGYPLLLKLLALGRRRREHYAEPDSWPSISITVPAFNEERQIREALESLLRLDYPKDRCQILVVSDASTDRTDEIVEEFANRGIELVRTPHRMGKTAAENLARERLTGEIIVNTDASIRILPDALKPLIAALADPSVGLASGRDVSVSRVGEERNVGESGYVGYEMWVRDLESRVDGIVGASGCFYAIRAPLHKGNQLPDGLSRDFAAALFTREQGYRSVSVNRAICFVPRTASLRREYQRKVRTMARGLQTLYYKRHLLNPVRYGLFSWMLFSHKLARWLVPPALTFTVVALSLLSVASPWARWLLVLGGILSIAAAVGWLWPSSRRVPRLFNVPAYLVAGLVAALHAWLKALRGDRSAVWEPTRRDVAVRGSTG